MNNIKLTIIIMVLAVLLSGIAVSADDAKYGGTLNFPLAYGNPGTLDPIWANRVEAEIVTSAIFDRLIRIDPATLSPKPAIAKSWDISDDGLEYTFYLREDVKFHNGDKLTARDVKFSYERVMDPEKSQITDLLNSIKGTEAYQGGSSDHISGIEVIDDYTIKITLNRLDISFLNTVGRRGSEIVPKDVIMEVGDDFSNVLIGSGPFKFVKFVQGYEIELEAFEDYYTGRPYLDKLVFKIMEEAAARVPAFMTKEIDFDLVFPAQYQVYNKNPQLKDHFIKVPELWTRHIAFNNNVFTDKRVRQAFNYAVDKELVVEKMVNGMAFPAAGWLPTSSPGFNPDLEGYDYDPAKAISLMKEAGYSVDNPFAVEILGTTNPNWGIPIVEAITPYLEKVGFKITPVLMDGASMSPVLNSGDFDAYIDSGGGRVEPIDYLRHYFWSEVAPNAGRRTRYSNPEFDAKITKGLKTPDFEKRMGIVQEAEKILVDDAPVWFFNYSQATGIKQPWVHGIVTNPIDLLIQPFAEIWVDENSPRK